MRTYDVDGQMSLFAQDGCSGKMSQGPSPAVSPEERISGRSLRKRPEWWTQPAMCLDLRKESGWVLGIFWRTVFPLRGEQSTHSFSEFPRDAEESLLSQILQDFAPLKYYLSKTACRGIIHRAKVRQKPLPGALRQALEIQSGLRPNAFIQAEDLPQAFACNQRDETRDLHSVSAALTAEPGMKAQTFITRNSGQVNNTYTAGFSAGAGASGRQYRIHRGTFPYPERVRERELYTFCSLPDRSGRQCHGLPTGTRGDAAGTGTWTSAVSTV